MTTKHNDWSKIMFILNLNVNRYSSQYFTLVETFPFSHTFRNNFEPTNGHTVCVGPQWQQSNMYMADRYIVFIACKHESDSGLVRNRSAAIQTGSYDPCEITWLFPWGKKVQFRVLSIGKSGFRFRISDFRFPNKTRNPKTDFDEPKSFFKTDFS